MGICGSSDMSPEQRNQAEMNRKIEEALARHARADRLKIKMLLLGSGESGKSTIFKQFQILYGEGFTVEERVEMKDAMHAMLLLGMKALLEHVEEFSLASGYSTSEKGAAATIRGLPEDTTISPADALLIKKLWACGPVQTTWERRSDFQIIEANQFFYNKIEEIANEDYVPSTDDILHLRIRTTGIIEQELSIDNVQFQIVDVGGQRNERKKWIHCFDDVSAVIFVAAISEFNQVLFEDYSQNRMIEALTLFEEICETSYFMHKPMILFLNKSDLFREKIQHTNIADEPAFDDFSGQPGNFDDGVEYFLDKFEDRNYQPNRKIYSHVTCATDSDNVRFVFESSRDIILGSNLAASGIS